MRKIILTLVGLIMLGVAAVAGWIFAGPKISLYVDRFGMSEDASEPVRSVRYEGSGTGGILHANDIPLSLNSVVAPVQSPSIGSTKEGKLGLAMGGKVFPLGQLPNSSNETAETMAAVPDPSDDARVILGHSKLSWPTPFEVNFMSGAAPSWRRHTYQRLTWIKPNGSKLEMLWRYEQHFIGGNGWTSPTMTREGETGLIKVEITP